MNNRDYYKVSYNTDSDKSMDSQEILDNEPEFNANQFKLFDDFTTDLRISFNPLRHNYHDITRRARRESGLDLANGNRLDDSTASHDVDLLENEVMVDPWSSMDSSNSPLTDSGPSASEDCTPSTSSDLPRGSLDVSPLSPETRRIPNPKDTDPKTSKHVSSKALDKARSRDLTLDLETLEPDPLPRRPHFLDEDYQLPSKSNIECRIPKPHFLDHSPSPDEFDERSDITNPNFLDDEVDGDDNQGQKKSGALPKRPQKSSSSAYSPHEDRPHRTSYRSALHYGLENAARSSERDKRASQLYRGTWPGERDVWMGHDSSSVRSFSSNGSADGTRTSSNLENKMECVCSLISLLSLSPENNADLSAPLLEMSRTVENCIAMRQAGCIPLLVQLIHSKVPRETRDRAAKALRNIIHTQTDDKAGRREARVWRLLEQVREYCHILEDLVEARKDGKEVIEDDATKHPSQSVAALMKLSFDEEHRHVVCQLGGLQALAALVSGDQAAHGSRTDDNTCLTMRKYAGMTLTNLTFGDGNNKSLLCSFKDFMLALVEQLESPNDDMRQVTAAVLRNLSWRADTNSKQVLREVGAVKGLTKAAMTCQKEATLKSVLSALWNLTAHCSMNKVALCSVDGALGFLVDMLSYNSPTKTLAIVENAGGIMRNVSSHIAVREDYRQILRERNCLSVLLQHLKSPSLTVVSNSCGTLWNLSARCPQDQQFLWDHGAVPMLRSLIHSKHKMIAMGSGAALKNLLNSKPGKTHIISLDTTARSLNLPALPTLNARKQKALEQELDQNLAETCDNIEPATSPSTTNRDEKNLFTATERQIAMNLERHRMTSSSPLMGTLASQISLSHSAHLASYLSCSNTLLKGALGPRATGSAGNVNRSDSKDSVTSTHSDSVFERGMRPGKVPVPTPRNKDLVKAENGDSYRATEPLAKGGAFVRYSSQPPVPTPRSTTDMRTNYTESGFDVDQDSCDQPIDYSRKYSETKTVETEGDKPKAETKKYAKKESPSYGDYQETDLDQPTDYSLRYAEHQSEAGSDSEPPRHSVHEDTIKHFATEGTPYETPIIFSTATSMSDLRIIGKDKPKASSGTKENPEVMSHSDEKDTCSIEEPPRHDNDLAATTPSTSVKRVFDSKFSSGLASPEKPVNYCDEGTPGCFSRVSSLSSLAEPTEEDNLAKRNAMATITVHPSPPEHTASLSKDKEGCKAVTFASEPVEEARYIEDTPLMFSRCSSLGSLPDCDQPDDQGSVVSDRSRMTSGCISPSEIPDSPGVVSPRGRATRALSTPSAPCSPPDPPSPADNAEGVCPGSVFEERTSQFVVEHTPAQFSRNTSLSSLTIDCDGEEPLPKLPREKQEVIDAENPRKHSQNIDNRISLQSSQSNVISNDTPKEPATPGEVCKVYFTEDTPAILSKAGSNSNLSALSIESGPPPPPLLPPTSAGHDSSDSSNLSDAGDLLEECIQKGIAKVVKNKGPPSEPSSMNPYRDDVYRSLPPYLRSSTETVKMSHEFARNVRDSRSASSSLSPPPLVARGAIGAAPPRPARPPDRSGSGSSLSLDSFGSTDREIFEETVQAGAGVRRPRASTGGAARERRRTSPSSLSDASFGSTDKEVFERSVRAGMPRARSHDRLERRRRRPRRPRPAPAPAPPQPPPRESKNVPEPSAERAPAGGSAPSARPLTGSDSPLSNEELAPLPPAAQCGRNPDDRDDLDRSNESYADVVDAWSETVAPPAPPAPLTELRLPTDDTDTWNEDTVPDDVTFPTLSGSLAALERSAGGGTGALPDLLESGSGAPRPPDVTARLAPLALDSLATREIEREAARLAARLRALHAATVADPPSLLDSVKPPSELDRLDMEGSMVSVASIASESGAAPLTFDLRQPVREFPLCSSAAFTLVDLDRVDPPSLFDELHESTLDVDPTPAPSTPPAPPTGPTQLEPDQPRRHLTPKERRLADADRYQTYTICDVPPAPAAPLADDPFITWTESTARAAGDNGDESPPSPGDDEASRPRRRPSARQRRAEDRARYRTQAVDVSVLPPPPADSELESLRRRLDEKRTSRQRRLDSPDRYRTRTLVEDAPPAPASPGDAENADTTTGYDSLSSNERHQLVDELPAPPAVLRADCDPSSGGYGSYEADEPPSPPPEPRPRPKIVAPVARDDSLESVESVEEAPKAIRGRRKTPYVSPYRRSAPPPAAPRRPAPRPVSTPAATRTAASARAPASAGSRPTSTTTSPKKSLPVRSPSKSASTKAGSTAAPRPLPLERQGTFTKEESSVPAAALPDVEVKPAAARRFGKSAPPAKIPPTSPSRLPQPRGAGASAGRAPPPSKTPTRSPTKVAKMRPSASNHSLQSDDSGRTVTLARSSRQGSASSVASVSSRTKDVESKIANLWKKVEQAKRQPAKSDRRVWIEAETPRLVRSSTFEGQPATAPQPGKPKQKSAIGMRVSQIPAPRARSTPAPKASTTPAPPTGTARRTTLARVFTRKPLNSQVT